MIEQLLRCLLAALSFYGWLRAVLRRLVPEPAFALPLCFSGLGLCLLLAGAAGLLLPALRVLTAAGLLLAGDSLRRREPLRALVRPGLPFFALCAVGALLLLYGGRLCHVDNFSHWGAILKIILRDDALPANDPLVYFPAYPPGSSLILYAFSRVCGIRAEWFWAWVQALFLAACAAPLLCLAQGRSRTESRVLRLLTGLTALALLCGNIDPNDLLVDTLVPLLGLTGVLLCLWERERLAERTAALLLLTAFLPMIKNSGYFFSLLLILFSLALNRGRARLLQPGVLLAGLLAVNRIWAAHVRAAFSGGLGSYHAMSLENFSRSAAAKTGEDLDRIGRAIVGALLREGRLPWLLAGLTAVAALLLLCGGARRLRRICLAVPGIWTLYMLSLLGMYVFSMSVGEATRAAAFDRYYRSITVFCTGLLWALVLLALRAADPARPRCRLPAALLSCALLLALCAPHPEYLLRQSRRPDDALRLRLAFDTLIRERHIPPGQGYLLFVAPEHEISGRVMCTYLLSPKTTVVCLEPDRVGDGLGGTDYYIILEETSASRELLARLGTDEPCGFHWTE